MIVGVVYVSPERVRVQESEMLFEMMKAKVTDYLRYLSWVILMPT